MSSKPVSINSNISREKTQTPANKTRGGIDYIINSMMLIAIVGICIKMFFGADKTTDGTSGPANAVIYGYGMVVLSVLTVIFISYGVHDKIGKIENKGNSIGGIIDFLKSFLTSSMPSVLTIGVLIWIISLNMTYYTQINKGIVAEEYYQLSSGTTFLFIFQLICLFSYLKIFIGVKTKTNTDPEAPKTQNRIAFATYFITTINLVIVGIMTIILQFFSTDG